MKLNLKQSIAISWIWYFTRIIFWIGVGAFFVYGFILLMSDKTTNKEQMQGNAGGAVVAIFFTLASLAAILQTISKYPKKRKVWEMDWGTFERRPVFHWDNLINDR